MSENNSGLKMSENNSGLKMSENNSCAPDVHPIFTKDPGVWMDLVHRLVRVTTEDDQSHSGYVYTVDPVSETVVLLNPSSLNSHGEEGDKGSPREDFSSPSLKLLPGASIRDITVVTGVSQGIGEVDPRIKSEFDSLFRPCSMKTLSAGELEKRKVGLKSWLEQHRLPVTLDPISGSLSVAAGALTVTPPYIQDSCLSTNEIILARIRALIRDMPDDIDR